MTESQIQHRKLILQLQAKVLLIEALLAEVKDILHKHE